MKLLIEELLTRIEQIEPPSIHIEDRLEVTLELLKKREDLIHQLNQIDLTDLTANEKMKIIHRVQELQKKNMMWIQQAQQKIFSLKEKGRNFVHGRQAAREYLATHESIGNGFDKLA